jgi:amino acid adenylation domain-containing protein
VLAQLRRAALDHPGRPALTDTDGTTLTYAELADRTGRLAAALRAAGVGPDVPVPVRLERSADVVVAMLAALESGGSYAPLDVDWPAARTALVLDRLGVTVCVTNQPLPDGCAVAGLTTLHPREAAPPASPSEPPAPHPDHLAYVLHTSGSTGTPKSVAMTHRGLDRLIAWQTASGPTGLTTLNFTASGFDVTFQEVLSTLTSGGRLVLVTEQVRRDPERLLATLEEQSVERIFLPYVALQQLAKAALRTGRIPRSLRHVITAGEQLAVTDAIAEFFGKLPDCRLDNHYGPTEAHLVTSHTLRSEDAPWPTLPAIGTAVTGADLRILDTGLAPVPAGEEGELFVSGAALARGYLRDPELTADRFLPDPYAAKPGARMYRTGDLVRRDADGTVHFVGRADNQIKVRGYRVAPAGVETVLTRHPGVREAVVGLRTLVDDVTGLVAYVVCDPDAAPGVAELLEHAHATLPRYMVPSRFLFVPELPLTGTGKVDRLALRSVALPREDTAAAGDEESLDEYSLTETVMRLWRRVLGHDEFDEDDDFFDIGGDSLLATWVVAELGRTLGQEIELALLLEESTVSGLVEALVDTERKPAVRRGGSEVRTLSPGPSNRALFLFHALGGELFAYRELARAIASPLRVLGVRLTGGTEATDGPAEQAARSVPDTVRMHLEQIRLVQPEGPYLLAGWSYGGVLAFEAARQLVAAGESVEFLGMIDANPLRDPITGLVPKDTPHLPLITRVLATMEAHEGGADTLDLARLAGDSEWTSLMGSTVTGTGMSAHHLKAQLRTAGDSMRAAIGYEPRALDADAVLFQAEATEPDTQRRLADDLSGLVRNLSVRPVPGDHNAMLTAPHVERLAAAVDEAIERSRETAAHGA